MEDGASDALIFLNGSTIVCMPSAPSGPGPHTLGLRFERASLVVVPDPLICSYGRFALAEVRPRLDRTRSVGRERSR